MVDFKLHEEMARRYFEEKMGKEVQPQSDSSVEVTVDHSGNEDKDTEREESLTEQ